MRRRRWILARSLVRETVPTFLLASGVATFLLLIRSLFVLANLFISHATSLATTAKILLLGVPSVLVLTIPIGALFAVLMTVGRLSADSELIAAQSCGVRLGRLARPLIGFALALTLLDAGLTLWVLPDANRRWQDIKRDTALSGIRAAVEQGAFTDDFPGHLLYVNRISEKDGRWHGVLLFDLTSPTEERLITAESGEFVQDPRDGAAWLNLSETTTHIIQPARPSGYSQSVNREQRIRLQLPTIDSGTIRRGPRETSTADLVSRIAETAPGSASEAHEARIELQKRLAIPVAALAFAFVAFPLGVRNRRGGRGFGLTASVGLVVVYYVLLINGENLARSGHLSVTAGVWMPNLVLFLTGLVLMRRASLGSVGGVWMRPLRWWRRKTAAGAATEARSESRPTLGKGRARCEDEAPEQRRRFNGSAAPLFTTIDRQLVRQCLAFFALVLVAVVAIYVTVDLTEKLDDIQRNAVPLASVLSYYLFSAPQILHEVVPLVFLIAFLGTATVIERHNETTALRAAGVSLTRVAAPLLVLGLLLGGGLFAMDESLVQRANRASQRLEDAIKGRKVARAYRATDKPWLFLPDGHTLVNFLEYDADTDSLLRPSIFVFDDHFNLLSLYMANSATYEHGKWMGDKAWSRVPGPDGQPGDFVLHTAPVELPIAAPPTYFGREYRKPSQMSFEELRSYISTLRAAGYRADKLVVQLHQKLAYPLSLAVLAWLALPYAFRMGRRGTIVGIALALVLGMAYFALTAFVTKLGEAALLPPAVAAWTPTVLFALLAANRHTTLKT